MARAQGYTTGDQVGLLLVEQLNMNRGKAIEEAITSDVYNRLSETVICGHDLQVCVDREIIDHLQGGGPRDEEFFDSMAGEKFMKRRREAFLRWMQEQLMS